MSWQPTPYVHLVLATASLLLGLAIVAWRRRAVAGAGPLALCLAAGAVWAACYSQELASPDTARRIFWDKLGYFGRALIHPAWLLFSVHYAGRQLWLGRRRWIWLLLVPAVTIVLVWTNGSHGLIWRTYVWSTTGPASRIDVTHGVWFWIFVAHAYAVMLFGTLLLLRDFLDRPKLYHSQAVGLLLGALAPWVANFAYLTDLWPIRGLDPTPFAFMFSGFAFLFAILRHKLLDLVPVAYDKVVRGMRDGVLVIDPQGRLVDLNPAAQRLLALDEREALGAPIERVLGAFARTPQAGGSDATHMTLGTGGAQRHFDRQETPLLGSDGRRAGRMLVLHDVTERIQAHDALVALTRRLESANAALERLSSQDGLTGIANRRRFDQFLEREWRRALRTGSPISVLMIDLDQFKRFNDTYGHPAGDEQLVRVARAIAIAVREGDLAARYGGEEFAVLLPDTDEKGVAAVAERVRAGVAAIALEGSPAGVAVTASVGLATAIAGRDMLVSELIATADRALYRAKTEGGNRVLGGPPSGGDGR